MKEGLATSQEGNAGPGVFVNRSLNLKQIQLIGFDMDYTLVRYNSEAFEALAHRYATAWLVEKRGYPSTITSLIFDYRRALVGLVIDKRNGNLLKLSRYGKIKMAFHGLRLLDFRAMKSVYQNVVVDLGDASFQPLDTLFAISTGVLFSQLIDLKDQGAALPDYGTIAEDSVKAVDGVHQNGSVKKVIRENLPDYVIRDPKVPALLERYKDYGKRLMVITNSDYSYTKFLLDYALDPFWKRAKSWREVFDVVVTLADKPRFFEFPSRFLKIDPQTGLMSNWEGRVDSGLFQGGWFAPLQKDMGLDGREILYIGDHIYGDVVSIKKRCDWRTALVLEDLEQEIAHIKAAQDDQRRIDALTERKEEIENLINKMDLERYEGKPTDRKALESLFAESDRVNQDISDTLGVFRHHFNPFWGEILRAGHEESRYAGQIDDYACVYMTRVSDLYGYSPKMFFRPKRRLMPHEKAWE